MKIYGYDSYTVFIGYHDPVRTASGRVCVCSVRGKHRAHFSLASFAPIPEIIEESLHNGDSKEELCVEYVLRTLNSTRPEVRCDID